MRAADEELLGSWASITPNLISFYRSKGLEVYTKIVDALDSMADPLVCMKNTHRIPRFLR